MQIIEYLKLSTLCLDNLAMLDVSIDEFPGHHDLNSILSGFGKDHIHPKLDPLRNDFTSENSLWLLAKKNGEYFGGVGSRLEELGAENVTEYWTRTTQRHYPDAGLVSFDHLKPRVSELHGRVAYLGDLFVEENSRGSPTFLTNFMLLMHLTVRLKWRIKYAYSFLRYVDIKKAKSHLYHYPTSIPDYQRWDNPPSGRANSEYLLTMSQPQFEHLMRRFLHDPNALIFEA